MKLAINATRIGGHACSYLAACMREGRVASTFRYGFNAILDEATTPTYIAIQTPAVPLHPWAIEVPGMPTRSGVGCAVRGAQFAVETAGTRFELLTAAREPLLIAPYSSASAQRAADNRVILNRLLDERRPRSVEAFEGEIRAVVAQWQTTGDPSLLANLVGLGSGSTPSGDDVLVGILAGLTALSGISAAGQELETLRQDLAGVSLRTHPASRQMLAAAADGSFPEPLVDLVSALGDAEPGEKLAAAAARVLALGATSGRSFLAGVLASLGQSRQFS
ncbi:MAG: DUF2877 domain-containing protein [Candidatus Bipolaricaulota bacterium]|nr:DUF2877 domain-containing protein [Candidatus Bipolaricaulota bacterium]